MSRSWRSVTPALVQAVARSPVVADYKGYRYVVQPNGEKLEQCETHAGDSQHRLARSADYVVGSGTHAVALVSADRGYLTELPVGWFNTSDPWKLNPGYELKNHRFSRPITAGCVACHATSAEHELATGNHFSKPIADGIDCSRCHGEAARHIDYWSRAGEGHSSAGSKLVHPGVLSPELANDVCLQCHLQGDVTLYRANHTPFDFRPGQRLLDQRHDLLIAGQPEKLGVASHGARMLQSRCYLASEGQLTCIHCHDAHQPAAAQPRRVYDAACAKCHQPAACSRPASPPGAETAQSCTGCHMPQRSTREGIHLVFTDHAIPRLPKTGSPSPPPLLKPNSHVELVSAWPGAAIDEATIGAAQALLHETMGPQLPSLEKASVLLKRVVASNPADSDSRYWLGSASLALGNAAEAIAQLDQVVRQQPQNYQARFRLALAQEAAASAPSATASAAIAQYERLIADVPAWLEPYSRLAKLYLAGQRPADAVRVLEAQLAQQPSSAAFSALALAQRLAGRSHEQALATVNRAIALDPRQPEAYLTRGTLWLLAGENGRARSDFERALAIDPENAVARQALQSLTARP